MRRSHGGAAHNDVLVGFGGSAIDGINAAARGSNLRLQGQIAGHAPGAKGAHGVDAILRDIDADAVLMADGHIAGVVQRIAIFILHSRTGSPDGVGVGLGDAHAGNGGVALGQIHADGCAGYIVINDTGGSASSGGVGHLLGEVQLTPGDKDDLTGDIDALVIRRVAQLIQEDVLPFRAGAVLGGVHGGQLVIVGSSFGVDHVPACCLEAGADHAGVVHRGHSEGVGVGSGRAASVEIDIFGV